MMGAIVFALMSACSNDEPNIPDDNDNPNPGNTEEPSELLPRWEKVFSQPMQGTDYDFLDLWLVIKNSSGTNLLETGGIKLPGYYFEYQGKNYYLGDTIPVPGNDSPVKIFTHYGSGAKVICPTMTRFRTEMANWDPIDYTCTFVWPQKDIRKKIRIRVEFNPNYLTDLKNGQDTLPKGHETKILKYKIGRWVNDSSIQDKYICDYTTFIVD